MHYNARMVDIFMALSAQCKVSFILLVIFLNSSTATVMSQGLSYNIKHNMQSCRHYSHSTINSKRNDKWRQVSDAQPYSAS